MSGEKGAFGVGASGREPGGWDLPDSMEQRDAIDEESDFLRLPHCTICGAEMDWDEGDTCADCFREELL